MSDRYVIVVEKTVREIYYGVHADSAEEAAEMCATGAFYPNSSEEIEVEVVDVEEDYD